jgi:Cu/Ag efflux pump CusA
VIAGLSSATLLTLFVIPALYSLVARSRALEAAGQPALRTSP